MKRIVILLGKYFPFPSANGVCIKHICSELKKNNIFSDIISMDRVNFGDSLVYPSELNLAGIAQSELEEEQEKYKDNLCESYPIRSKYVVSKYYEALICLMERNNYDGVICVVNPIETVEAVQQYLAKNEIKNIVIGFDSIADYSKTISISHAEKRLKSYAESILPYIDRWFQLEGSEEWFLNNISNYYHSKITFFGIPLLCQEYYRQSFEKKDNVRMRSMYLGTLSKGNREPFKILELLKASSEESILDVAFYAKGDYEEQLIEYDKCNEFFSYNNFVSDEMIGDIMESADVLISIGNAIFIKSIPSKIIQYIATGKPIIHFYFEESESAMKKLSTYPLCLCINVNQNFIENVGKIIGFIKENKGKQITWDWINTHYHINSPKNIADQIRLLLDY